MTAQAATPSVMSMLDRAGLKLVVLEASAAEREAHETVLATLRSQSGQPSLWERLALAEADTAAKSP